MFYKNLEFYSKKLNANDQKLSINFHEYSIVYIVQYAFSRFYICGNLWDY